MVKMGGSTYGMIPLLLSGSTNLSQAPRGFNTLLVNTVTRMKSGLMSSNLSQTDPMLWNVTHILVLVTEARNTLFSFITSNLSLDINLNRR